MQNKLLLSGLAAGMAAGGISTMAAGPAPNTMEAEPAKISQRPNILFIFSDDHANRAISAYGGGINKTPNIDRIGNEGAVFINSFCANSICGPSRACIVTGKHSNMNGVTGNGSSWNGSQFLFPRELKKSGYETALIGKWHINGDPGKEFNYWKILIGKGRQGSYFNPTFRDSKKGDTKSIGYSTDLITADALKWLKHCDKKKPFMLMVQFKAPHVHRIPAPRFMNKYDGKTIPEPSTLFDNYKNRLPYAEKAWMQVCKQKGKILNIVPQEGKYNLKDKNYSFLAEMTPEQRKAYHKAYDPDNKKYFAMIKAGKLKGRAHDKYVYQRFIKDYLGCVAGVDDNVGKLLKYLDKTGLDKNTIVIYSSDQSYFTGEHGWAEKRFMYEQALKMPFLIRWPGVVKPGRKEKALIQNIDYAPTFLEAAGVKIPAEVQGKSLVPILKGDKKNWRKSIYYHYYDHGRHNVPRHHGVRTDRYKLINFYTNGDWEFYDLKTDPEEMKSQYTNPAYAGIIKELKVELERLRKYYKVPDSVFKPPYTPLGRGHAKPRKGGKKGGRVSVGKRSPKLVKQAANGTVTLTPKTAGTTIGSIRITGAKKKIHFSYWRNVNESVSWKIDFKKAGKYTMTVFRSNPKPAAVIVAFGADKKVCKIPATGAYRKYKDLVLGIFKVAKPGTTTLTVTPVKNKWKSVNFGIVKLTPVK
jgi:arylsulfatase A-like enzyme